MSGRRYIAGMSRLSIKRALAMRPDEIGTPLAPAQCRWPLGDPREPDFRFCRAPVARSGEPYCAEHRALAWRSPGDLAADRAA